MRTTQQQQVCQVYTHYFTLTMFILSQNQFNQAKQGILRKQSYNHRLRG